MDNTSKDDLQPPIFPSAILPDARFTELIAAIADRPCELIVNHFGNWGDKLIHEGFVQLLMRNNIQIVRISRLTNNYRPDAASELILAPGGGSVGSFYSGSPGMRKALAVHKTIPKILLPQSAFDDKENLDHFEVIFAREQSSYNIMKGMGCCRYAPDGALALRPEQTFVEFPNWVSRPPVESIGHFLRKDRESVEPSTKLPSVNDPSNAREFRQFLLAPTAYKSIVTNRLHFAIWAILLRRKTILLNNSYHKNQSMYASWLADPTSTEYSKLIQFSTFTDYERYYNSLY